MSMNTGFESRHLGPIVLGGGMGHAVMNGQVTYDGGPLTVRLEIDRAGSLTETIVNDVDIVLDNLSYLDGIGRDTISAGLRRDETAPSRLLRAWRREHPGATPDKSEFVHQLRTTHITITPDGGHANRDRFLLSYRLADPPPESEIIVRFREPTGPELAP